MNGVGFEILARTPVLKLPLSYRVAANEYTDNVCFRGEIRINKMSTLFGLKTPFLIGEFTVCK